MDLLAHAKQGDDVTLLADMCGKAIGALADKTRAATGGMNP